MEYQIVVITPCFGMETRFQQHTDSFDVRSRRRRRKPVKAHCIMESKKLEKVLLLSFLLFSSDVDYYTIVGNIRAAFASILGIGFDSDHNVDVASLNLRENEPSSLTGIRCDEIMTALKVSETI